jgi:hypothetical protein
MTRARPKAEPRTGVGFVDPPEPPKRYDWEAIAKRCRRQPGKWFLVFEQDRQTLATTLRQDGASALQRRKGFEVRTVNNNINVRPRVCDLYVRYVPELDTTKEK